MATSETLIVGAGLIGSSVAMCLAERGIRDIRVVDFDLEGTLSSSELNAGGVRATFAQPFNIDCSRLTIDYLATVAAEVGYRDCGYLWLHTPARLPAALAAREAQLARGWPVESWDVAELRRRVPFIDKTDDLAGAIFAPRDGLVNANLLKQHLRARARALGVVFEDRVWIDGASRTGDGGFKLRGRRADSATPIDEDLKREVLTLSQPSPGTPREWLAARVINCAGAWAPELAKVLGYACPSRAIRRQICLFDCRDVDLSPYGMIVDPSGVYFHPEATYGIAGYANTEESPGLSFAYDGEAFFMERIWPALYERATGFERLRHLSGWGGLYEVSPDESAIIGEPIEGRVFEAHSFSGHGVMHCYAAGVGLAEKIIGGRYETIDLSPFAGDRFAKGKLLHETQVI